MQADPTFWDARAESYYKQPVEDQEAWERKQAVTLELVEPTHTVLDIGCGTGSLALILAPHAAQVHALDISPEMLRIGRTRAEADGVENITFHQGTLEQLEALEDGILDGVCAYSILHLVDDPAETVARIHRLLKPGGWFVSSTVCIGGRLSPYGVILPVMRWFGMAPHVHMLRSSDVPELFRDAGFVDIRTPDVGAKPNIAFVVARKPG